MYIIYSERSYITKKLPVRFLVLTGGTEVYSLECLSSAMMSLQGT